MSVTIKSAREIELMRTAGKLLEEVHNELAAFVKPGISTLDIDRLGEKLIRERGCIPNFLNYNGYPASICVSVNDEVVHGIPRDDRILQEGDIVSLDAGLIYKGYHSDAARTHAVGKISPEAQKLMEELMEPCDSEWRGLGVIPGSGLVLKKEWENFDARKKYAVPPIQGKPNPACRCGDVLQGKCKPSDCKVFGKVCTPQHPVGACMVSNEGACSAYFMYGN